MVGTDIILFDAKWDESASPKTYGTFKDLYASAYQYPDAVNPAFSAGPAPTESNGASVFVVTRPLNPGKDNTAVLEKDKNYLFVYATNSKGGNEKHDYAGQYWMNITKDGVVTLSDFSNNAKKMVAAGAALASMAAVSYLI